VYLFTGQHDHKIDPKDRVVIPAAYAAAVTAQGKGIVYVTPGADGPYLEAYPADVFETMAEGQKPNRFDGDLARKRRFFGNAEPCELNGPGRITIPQRFRTLFPKGEVRVVGMNTYLELWDPGLWDEQNGTGIQGFAGGEAAGRPGPQ